MPMAVALVCGFLLLLSLGIIHVSKVAMVNVMLVLFVAPVSLAAVLGAEYGEPNFWSSELEQIPYLLTQPIAHSAYVMARIKVAILSLVVWAAVFADAAIIHWLESVAGMSYGPIGWLGYEAVTEVDWIRLLCWQFAKWSFPALGCGLGIAARMLGRGCPMLPSLRKGPIMLGCLWIGLSIVLGILAGRSLPIREGTRCE